jgi:RHS repeat-associated protein
MLVPNRHGSSNSYRYGFQGQEKDDEIKGEGNSLNYTFRMHDPRVGRFFATDPLEKEYPWYTPYSFSGNKVIAFVELEGMEERWVIQDNTVVYAPGPRANSYDSEASAYRALNAMKQKHYQHTTTISQDKRTPEQKERQRKQEKWKKVQDDSQKLIYSNPTNIIAHGVAVGVPELALEVTGAKIVDFVGDTYKVFKVAKKSKTAETAVKALDERAKEIHSVLPEATQRRTTTAVAEVTNSDGTTSVLVSSSEVRLRPAQRSVLKTEEVAVKGAGHAEQTIINHANANGQKVKAVGASRPICSNCENAINNAGAKPVGKLKGKE